MRGLSVRACNVIADLAARGTPPDLQARLLDLVAVHRRECRRDVLPLVRAPDLALTPGRGVLVWVRVRDHILGHDGWGIFPKFPPLLDRVFSLAQLRPLSDPVWG